MLSSDSINNACKIMDSSRASVVSLIQDAILILMKGDSCLLSGENAKLLRKFCHYFSQFDEQYPRKFHGSERRKSNSMIWLSSCFLRVHARRTTRSFARINRKKLLVKGKKRKEEKYSYNRRIYPQIIIVRNAHSAY